MNPFDMLKDMNNMKSHLSKIQETMNKIEVTGSAGGGIVKVTMNGEFSVVKVELDPIAVDPRYIPMLQDLIVAACSDATSRVKELMTQQMSSAMGGLNIPGMGI